MAYPINIDVNTPDGDSDYPSVLDDQIRGLKVVVNDMVGTLLNATNGNHKNLYILPASGSAEIRMVDPSAVGAANRDCRILLSGTQLHIQDNVGTVASPTWESMLILTLHSTTADHAGALLLGHDLAAITADTTGSYIELRETAGAITAPAADDGNKRARLYMTNAAGKSRISAIFESGAAQTIATEP